MASQDSESAGTEAKKFRKNSPQSRDGASGSSGQRRARAVNERSAADGSGPAADYQDEVVERKDELAVFVGNLRTDLNDETLKENIVTVFETAGVDITAGQVMLVHKAFATHAFIYLVSAEEKTWAMKSFGRQMDVSGVAIPGRKLKVRSKSIGSVTYRRPETSSMHMSALTERSSIDSTGGDALPLDSAGAPLPVAGMVVIDEDSSDEGEVVNAVDTPPVEPQKAAMTTRPPLVRHKQFSPQAEPTVTCVDPPHQQTTEPHLRTTEPHLRTTEPHLHHKVPHQAPQANHHIEMQTQTVKQPHTMSTTNMKFYVIGQNLGNESRHMEFKAGQGSYMQKQLKEHVAKYICAFLNSEGGTLLVGVNDSGEVLGIQCTQHIEDLLRQKMDATIKEIAPQVFPNMYTIDFVPVCDIAHVPLENRKVLEITVRQTSMSSLYQTHHGHVFIRRDGSVQGPLKASDIQEWTRMVMRRELEEREVALQAVQLKDKRLEREMDKQRKMTIVLTRELKIQRHAARHLKAQLRRIEPKLLKRIEARQSDKLSVSEDDDDGKRECDDSNDSGHVDTTTPVVPANATGTTTNDSAGTTTNDTAGTTATQAPHKPRTRGSIMSRISALMKPHKLPPVECTPSPRATPHKETPFKDPPVEDKQSEPHMATPLRSTPPDPRSRSTPHGSNPPEVPPVESPPSPSVNPHQENNSSDQNCATSKNVPRKRAASVSYPSHADPQPPQSRSCAIM